MARQSCDPIEGLWRRYCKPPERPRCAPGRYSFVNPDGAHFPDMSLLLSITGQGPLHEVGTPRSAAPGDQIPGTITSIKM